MTDKLAKGEHISDETLYVEMQKNRKIGLVPSEKIGGEPTQAVIAAGTILTVAGTTAATVGAVSSIKQSLDDLGPWLVPALALAVVGLAAYIVWQRFEQRRKGWA